MADGAAGTVLHIGYQKTASTLLQQQLFPNLRSCRDLRRHEDFLAFALSVEHDDDHEFPVGRWRELLSEMTQPDRTLLISRESFSQVPHWHRTADRLRALVPSARVLLVVRNQETMIPSLHGQHLKGGGYLKFADWVSSMRRSDWLQYDQVVDRYRQLYGSGSVQVMAYERLAIDPASFIDDVCAYVAPGDPPFAGRTFPTVNPAISRPSRWVFRQTNRLFRRSRRNDRPVLDLDVAWRAIESGCYHADRLLLHRLLPRAGRRDRELLASLLPTFRDGNARLARLTGLPLASYGYPLPAPLGPDTNAQVP